MTTKTSDASSGSQATPLAEKKCQSCDGKQSKLSPNEVKRLLGQLNGWQLSSDGNQIFKQWQVKDFMSGMRFFQRISQLAEAEDHHPDLHLCEYRKVRVDLSTHTAGGLTENDFILAAKIDQAPIELKE